MLSDSFDSCCSRDVNACAVILLNNLKLNRDICTARHIPLILCLPPAPRFCPVLSPTTQIGDMLLMPEHCFGAFAWSWTQDQSPRSLRIRAVLSQWSFQPPCKLKGLHKFESLQIINESFLYVWPREGDMKAKENDNKKQGNSIGIIKVNTHTRKINLNVDFLWDTPHYTQTSPQKGMHSLSY